MSHPRRRLSDKIIDAFNMACDQGQLDTAEHLLHALEVAVTRYGGHPQADKRKSIAEVVDAYERLQTLKRSAQVAAE